MKRKSDEDNKTKSKSMRKSTGSSDLMDKSSDDVTGWSSHESICIFKYKFKNESKKNKIAAFDVDGTLIKTKSGEKFAKDLDDWKMLNSAIKVKINKLIKDDYELVIFSNQTGIRYGYGILDDIKTKFENIIRHLDIPCVALFCTDVDKFRKPCTGMFDYYQSSINTAKLDLCKSFYCGDAMGRKGDHSAADVLFAFNCKLPFIPIESFLSGFERPKLYTWNNLKALKVPEYPTDEPISPKIVKITKLNRNEKTSDRAINREIDLGSIGDIIEDIDEIRDGNPSELTMILLVGASGSGKTHFVENYLDGYLSIDYSVSKDLEKCKKLLEVYKEDRNKEKPKYKGIVVDQPNLDFKSRKDWFDFLQFYNNSSGQIVAIYFDLSLNHCLHNILFRSFFITKCGLKKYPRMSPKFDLIKEHSQLVRPKLIEGFNTVYELNFVPNFNLNDLDDEYYKFISPKP